MHYKYFVYMFMMLDSMEKGTPCITDTLYYMLDIINEKGIHVQLLKKKKKKKCILCPRDRGSGHIMLVYSAVEHCLLVV